MEVNLQRTRLILSVSDQRSRRFYSVHKVYWLLSGLPKPLTKPFTTLSSGLPLGILSRSRFISCCLLGIALLSSVSLLSIFFHFISSYISILQPVLLFCVHNPCERKKVIFLSITFHNTYFLKIFFPNVIWHNTTN